MAGENDAVSLSPESQKLKVTNEVIAPLKLNQELFKEHKSYEKYLESFGEVKGQVLGLVGRCIDLEKKCDNLIRSEEDALKDKNNLQEKLGIANAKLDARPFLEVTESHVVPPWLRNAKWLNHVDKWYLSFKYEVTRCAKILRSRIGEGSDYYMLSESLVLMYNALPNQISHDGTPRRPLILTDEQWKELFEISRIYQESDQCLIKTALKPITQDEYRNIRVTDHYFLSVENIGINLESSTEEDETTNIKKICGKYAQFVGNFYYPTNRSGKYTNQVYFQVDVVNDDEINDVIEILRNYGQLQVPTADVKIHKYRVYSNN